MKPTINPKATQLANEYRHTDGSEYEGGLVIVYNNEAGGWMRHLNNPQGWMPGCIAVDINGNQWVASGGDDYNGSEQWVAIPSDNDENKANSMNNTKHLMIDIEAAGKSTSAALLSIGAVFFDPATGELGEQFYQPIKLASAQYHGGTIDASTVEWWMKQSEEARSVFNAENRVSLKNALHELSCFIETTAGDADVHVWGNGPAYDNAILATAFHATWIKQPWSFSKDTCVRTMVMLGRQLGIDPKYDLPMKGEHHNALDDAIHQARYVSTIWQTLFAPHIAMPEEDCLECGGYGRVCTDADSIDGEETCEACHGSGAMKGSKAYEEHCNR